MRPRRPICCDTKDWKLFQTRPGVFGRVTVFQGLAAAQKARVTASCCDDSHAVAMHRPVSGDDFRLSPTL